MAKLQVPLQDVGRAGISLTYLGDTTAGTDDLQPGTPSTGDQYQFLNNERVMILIRNGTVADTVTFVTTAEIDGIALPDRDIAIAASAELFIGPFPSDVYNNSDRRVELIFTGGTTIEMAAIRLP